jgi:hypothetical protein
MAPHGGVRNLGGRAGFHDELKKAVAAGVLPVRSSRILLRYKKVSRLKTSITLPASVKMGRRLFSRARFSTHGKNSKPVSRVAI